MLEMIITIPASKQIAATGKSDRMTEIPTKSKTPPRRMKVIIPEISAAILGIGSTCSSEGITFLDTQKESPALLSSCRQLQNQPSDRSHSNIRIDYRRVLLVGIVLFRDREIINKLPRVRVNKTHLNLPCALIWSKKRFHKLIPTVI